MNVILLPAFHNGQYVQIGDVSIRAEDIQALDFVKSQKAEQNNRRVKSPQTEDESPQLTKVNDAPVHVLVR